MPQASRRRFLKASAAAPLLGGLPALAAPVNAPGPSGPDEIRTRAIARYILARYRLRTLGAYDYRPHQILWGEAGGEWYLTLVGRCVQKGFLVEVEARFRRRRTLERVRDAVRLEFWGFRREPDWGRFYNPGRGFTKVSLPDIN